MSKNEFLDKLCQGLRHNTSADEIQRTVMFYSEAIDDRIEDGMSEEEAVAAMGDIDDIVREVRRSWSEDEAERDTRRSYDGVETETGDVHRVYPPEGVARLEVFDTSGEINILPSADGLIHLEYTASDRWRYEISEGSTLSIRRTSNSGSDHRSIRFDVLGRRFSMSLPNFDGVFEQSLRLTVRLPLSFAGAVNVNVASGDVKSESVGLSELSINTAGGDISLDSINCSGTIKLVTASGDANIEDVAAQEISVVTVSGDIDLNGCRMARIALKTVSGDIDAVSLDARDYLSAGCVSGDIDLSFSSPAPSSTIDSVSGDVDLLLPGGGELYTIIARSSSGEVRVPRGFAGGGSTIRIKTMSGDIDVNY